MKAKNVRIDAESYLKMEKISKKKFMKFSGVVCLAINNLAKKEKIELTEEEIARINAEE